MPTKPVRTCLALAFTGLVLVPPPASADEGRFYLRADLGRGFADSSDFGMPYSESYASAGTATDFGTYGNTRIASFPWANLGLGYDTGRGFRMDGNLSYLSASLGGEGGTPGSPGFVVRLSPAKLEVFAGLLNGYLELAGFLPQTFRTIHPYVGAGGGVARIDVGRTSGGYADTRAFSQTNLAWDAVAGVGIPLSGRVSADLMYAYTDLGRIEGGGYSVRTATRFGSATDTHGPFRTDLAYHRISLGLRLALGAGGEEEAAAAVGESRQPGGFYLRGDLGAGFLPGAHYTVAATQGIGGAPRTTSATSDDFGDKTFGAPGIGLGYSTGRGLRADETLSYFSTSFAGRVAPGFYSNAVNSTNQFAADLNVLAALSNAYVEFGDFYPETFPVLRPYVGAGIGLARIQLSSGRFGSFPELTLGGANRIAFAWDAVAGLEMPLGAGWTADLMYSYLNLGRFQGRVTTTSYGTTGSVTTGPLRTDLDLHRVSMGLRYAF